LYLILVTIIIHRIYEYDTFQVADDCSPLAVYGASEFRIDSFYISLSLSPNQRWLTSTSGNSIYLFELNRPERPAFRIEGHSGEINNQNWSADSEQLASCADDGKIKFWQFDSDASECRQQQQWFQQTRTALEELGKVTEDEVDSETRQMNEKFTLARCTAPKIISSMPKQQQQLPFKQQNPTRKKKTVKRSKTTPTTAGQQQSRMRQENTTPNRTVRTLEFYGFGTASTTTSPPISSAAFVNNIT
jgi:hypothetical protein